MVLLLLWLACAAADAGAVAGAVAGVGSAKAAEAKTEN